MEIPQITRQAIQNFTPLAIFPVQNWHFPCLFKPAVSLLVHHRTQELFSIFLYIRSSLKREGRECWTLKFSVFPFSFQSASYFSSGSHQLLCPFYEVWGPCTSAKTSLMLNWRLLFWTLCKAMSSFIHPFFSAAWNPVSHFVWSIFHPLKLILDNAELLLCHFFPHLEYYPLDPLNIPS